MPSAGQIEALVCEAVNAFLRGVMGRGATTMSATLRPGMLVVHLREVLTHKERTLATGDAADRRGEAMVREARDLLVRRGHEELATLLVGIVGRRPAAILHDVDPGTGDEVLAFTFPPPPNTHVSRGLLPTRSG